MLESEVALSLLWVLRPIKDSARMKPPPEPRPMMIVQKVAPLGSNISPSNPIKLSEVTRMAIPRWSLVRLIIGTRIRPGMAEASCKTPCSVALFSGLSPIWLKMAGSQLIMA